MRAGTGPTIGSSNRRIRFAVNRGFSHSHCLIRSRHGSRVPGRGGDTRTGGVGRPMARRTVLTSNFNRRATSFGTPSTTCRWRISVHWGHPDHLRVLLARSTRRPCLAPSIIARESLFPSAQGVLFHVAATSRAASASPPPTRPERLRHLAVPFLDTIVNRGRVIPENGVDIKVVVNYYISHGSVVHKMEPDAGRPRS